MPTEAYVIGSPVAVGHVRPLLPLARRLVERGYRVVWAISGDSDEPAAAWAGQLADLGVHFVDVDAVVPFARGTSKEITSGDLVAALLRRIVARANDVAARAAEAIRAATLGLPIAGGIYDYFGLWAYVAMRRLDVAHIDSVISAFPASLDDPTIRGRIDDAVYLRELGLLRASNPGPLEAGLRYGVLPRDGALRILSFSSPRLCPDAPAGVHVLGVQADALPRREAISTAPEAHQELARRLQRARESGTRVVLLSMGTVVMRIFGRMGPTHSAFLTRLYTTIAAAALRAGALVVASTSQASAAEMGVDEATLGPAARERVIAMPFVPQPLLFAHGLVDLMLTHGGANTFHEAIVSAIPLLVCPGFGDQESVALAAAKLGVGVAVESITFPDLPGALPLQQVADDIVPAMLAPGTTRWKAAAVELAAHIAQENGLDAAEALVLGRATTS